MDAGDGGVLSQLRHLVLQVALHTRDDGRDPAVVVHVGRLIEARFAGTADHVPIGMVVPNPLVASVGGPHPGVDF